MKTDLAQMRRWVFLIVIFGFALGCRRSGVVISKAMPDADCIAAAVISYRMFTRKFPTTEQALAALIKRPDDLPSDTKWFMALTHVPNDPWGNEYQYTLLSTDDDPKFEIRSLEPDGIRSEDDIVSTY